MVEPIAREAQLYAPQSRDTAEAVRAMTIRNLSALLHPKSVAVIGGSERPGSLGTIVLGNVLAGRFSGPVYAVNPHRLNQPGAQWITSIDRLPEAPDVAVVVTPATAVPEVISELGTRGTKCAIVISNGITAANGLKQRMLDAARPHLLRVVGPNCLGVIAPQSDLDTTFARTRARPGGLALISQSGALATAMLDWAQNRAVGFSGVVSVGDMADVDLGDLVDLFAVDPATEAILLYVEAVSDAAKFLSAARAAALAKPVIAIKGGRSAAAAQATLSHTGALAGAYDVYRAAFERAGIVMVDTLTELFDAAQVLSHRKVLRGNRLGIVTNGGGAGILAVDALSEGSGELANLSQATIEALDRVLPASWSRANPVDVLGDATRDRYHAAVGAVLRDPELDCALIMHCPTGTADPAAVATAVVAEAAAVRGTRDEKPVLACWLGPETADAGQAMTKADIPVYALPEEAVRGFGHLLAARQAREALTDAPVQTREVQRDKVAVRRIIDKARGELRTLLTEVEAKALLAAYGVPTVPTRFAETTSAVEEACGGMKPPYAVKVVSPDISHKSDVGGVALDLPDPSAAAQAATEMAARIGRERADAQIVGYAVEEMADWPDAIEMFAGIATDPTFGPVVMVGAGGTAVEIVADKAIALPPFDHAEALGLIAKTRIAKLLHGYRNVPAVDVDAVADVLDALSAMATELSDVVELDINPLLVAPQGVAALDARIRISAEARLPSRLAIRPAPTQWVAELETRSGLQCHVRPVRADDEPVLAEFFTHVTPEDLRFRFLSGISIVDHDRLAMMTRVDYRRTITFLVFDKERQHVLATAMLAADPDRTRAEVALATRSDMKGQGLSWALFEHVLKYAQAERIGVVEAVECADNEAALRMEREMGFTVSEDPDDPTLRIVRRELAWND